MTRLLPKGIVVVTSICVAFLLLAVAFFSVFFPSQVPAFPNEHSQVKTYLITPFAEESFTFLDEEARVHMHDVKRLFMAGGFLVLLALGILAGFLAPFISKKRWRHVEELCTRSFWNAGWTLLSICFVLGLAVFLSFEKFWVLFHVILFPQGNWLFPADSMLIQMYPGKFFQMFALTWLLRLLVLAILAVVLSLFFDRMLRHERVFKNKN